MPLYEYQCDSCSHRFEAIQKFSDPPLEECPKCGAAVRKLQAAPAFQFKGSGWYITDYAKKEGTPTGKTDDPAPASPPKSDSTAAASSDSTSTSKTPDSSTGSK